MKTGRHRLMPAKNNTLVGENIYGIIKDNAVMMDKNKLRTADIFSGGLIFFIGTYIVSQALQMPMKDSWGGVQNVWYVSPAIFPLFIGAMIMLLGGLLVRTAVKEVGIIAVKKVGTYLVSSDFLEFLKQANNIRFYAIVTALLSFVFIWVSRTDFFLAAILFLIVSISMFHLDDSRLLVKLFFVYLAGILTFILFLVSGLNAFLSDHTAYPGDWLTLVFILLFAGYALGVCRGNSPLMKKLRTSFIVAFLSPILIGMIFKYLLLVPMPFEGMVVELMDFIWYY